MEYKLLNNRYKLFLVSAAVSIMIFTAALTSSNPAIAQGPVQTININENDTKSPNNILLSNGTIKLSSISAPLHKVDVKYYKNTSGYLVYPEISKTQSNSSDKKLPAVIMIHEWWGLNDIIKNMADELAKQGYAVLAVDLYNGKVASNPKEAMELVNTARNNQNESTSNMLSALKYLKTLNYIDQTKIASLGWCFGGGQSLQLALNTDSQNPLAATVLYYGNLVTDEKSLSKISWPVLSIFGSLDKSIPASEVEKFEKALNSNNITNEIFIYDGVGHAFANPTGGSFAPEELKDAWEKTISFLEQHVKS